MWPRLGSSTFVSSWILLTLAASISSVIDGGWLASTLSLAPSKIFHGQVWRLVTWPLIEAEPMSLVLTCVAIYKFGSELAVRWGDRRLRRFMLELVLAGSGVTCLVAALVGRTWFQRLGGWAVGDALVIAWARQFPEARLVLYHVLVLHGQRLIAVTIGATVVYAMYAGPFWMLPELVICAAAALYPVSMLRRGR